MVSEQTGITPLQRLLDRMEIVEAIDRLNKALEKRDWATVRSLLTEEVEADHLLSDGGEPTYMDAEALMNEWRAALGGFDATQHAVTNHAGSVVGDGATCSAHVQAKHYLPNYMGSDSWTLGGCCRYGLVRARRGWQVRSARMDVLWAEGNRQLLEFARRRFEEGLADGRYVG